jgi:hypothetical protein
MNPNTSNPQTQTQTQAFSLIDTIRKKFENIPVAIEEHEEKVCVKLTQRVDDGTFRKYVETAKSLGMRFSDRMWCAHKSTIREKITNVVGKYYRSFYYFPHPRDIDGYETLREIACYTIENGARKTAA